jgi:hypothetical protein
MALVKQELNQLHHIPQHPNLKCPVEESWSQVSSIRAHISISILQMKKLRLSERLVPSHTSPRLLHTQLFRALLAMHTWCMCGGQRTVCGVRFSSTTWASEIGLRLSNWLANSSACSTTSSSLISLFIVSSWGLSRGLFIPCKVCPRPKFNWVSTECN